MIQYYRLNFIMMKVVTDVLHVKYTRLDRHV
jgi:hypothetical protein